MSIGVMAGGSFCEGVRANGLMAAYEALSKAGDDMVAAFEKNSQGYGYKYASLQQFTGTVRRVLAAHGLAIVQPIDYVNGEQILRTQIYYKGYHEPIVSSIVPLKEYTNLADEGGAKQKLHPGQKQGAGITYARKYAIQAILCLAPDETDFDLDDPRIAPQAPKKEVVAAPKVAADPAREEMLSGLRIAYKADPEAVTNVLASHGLTTAEMQTCPLDKLKSVYDALNRGEVA
jgi:hypothetical protein